MGRSLTVYVLNTLFSTTKLSSVCPKNQKIRKIEKY
jgi:hypothetical protein